MHDLHLVGLTEDGEHLVLSAQDGTQLRLPLDDRLLAAIRGDLVRLGQLQIEMESTLRPAAIQARIRAGESAEAVAMAAGVPVAKVRRYEGPVLAEREHVATQARRTPVRRRGDGFVPLLGEVVAERLAARGVPADAVVWDSHRREDGSWEVTVAYRQGSSPPTRAAWAFDPRRRILGATDDEARRLSDEHPVEPAAARRSRDPERSAERSAERVGAGGSVRRLTSVPRAADAAPIPAAGTAAEPVAAPAEPVLDAPVLDPPAGPPTRTPPAAAAGAGSPPAAVAPAAPPVLPIEPPPPALAPGDTAAASAPPEAEAAPDAARPGAEEEPAPPRRAGARPPGRGRRAAVPAWDDIVFGARRRD